MSVSGASTSGVRPVLQTLTSDFYVREDGIIVQTVTISDELSIVDVEVNMRLFVQLADGEPRRLLVHMAGAADIEPEAHEYQASDEGSRFIAALAIVTPKILARVLENLSLWLNRRRYPCRMFGSLEAAAAWLLQQPPAR
jgi:hypothetical protein